MRAFTTKSWTNATISIYAATTGLGSWIRADNVSLKETPGSATTGTECMETGEAAADSPVVAQRALETGGVGEDVELTILPLLKVARTRRQD
jgi:hypothetical protein